MISILLIIGGSWVIQDSLASILYYLKKDGESWYYNQLLRIIRLLWGLVILICAIKIEING